MLADPASGRSVSKSHPQEFGVTQIYQGSVANRSQDNNLLKSSAGRVGGQAGFGIPEVGNTHEGEYGEINT